MSFGGHVNDMVNRIKQNAALKNARKGKFKGGNNYSYIKYTKTEYDFPKVSEKELEKIKIKIRKITTIERNKHLILGVIIIFIAVLALLVLNS
jgi:hypothetical protein